jgi:hypothetical protein
MPISQSDLLGQHPLAPNIFNDIFSALDLPVKANQRIRNLIATNKLSKKDTIEWLARRIIVHHYSEDRIKKLKDKYTSLGFPTFAAQNRKLPTADKTRKGNAAEVMLFEYVQACLAGAPLVSAYRLRYNPNVDQAMKGDDMLIIKLAKDKKGRDIARIYLGEAKYRSTPSKVVVDDITKALDETKKPISFSFLVDYISKDDTQKHLVDALDNLIIEEIKKKGDLIYCGLLYSNSDVYKVVEANLNSSNENLIIISTGWDNPEQLITDAFTRAEELTLNPTTI